eukprot:5452465-Pleurochrysis_carterae.AAC.1
MVGKRARGEGSHRNATSPSSIQTSGAAHSRGTSLLNTSAYSKVFIHNQLLLSLACFIEASSKHAQMKRVSLKQVATAI